MSWHSIHLIAISKRMPVRTFRDGGRMVDGRCVLPATPFPAPFRHGAGLSSAVFE